MTEEEQARRDRPAAGYRSDWIRDRQAYRMVALAVAVGVASGLGGVALRLLRATLQDLLFVEGARLFPALGALYFVLLPALGGLLVGPVVAFLAREVRGAGVSDVVLAVQAYRSRMRARVAAVKVVATSMAIASGQSAGIEGPIVQIGSALGSALGQWRRLREEERRVVLAAGAAGGIAATFDTPLAGVFFALEVILLDFSSRSFGLVVLSAVVANVVSRLALGPALVLSAPQHTLVHPLELPLYLLLGGLAAVVGVTFTLTLDRIEAAFSRWLFPDYLKPAAGGLLVGLLGLVFPQILGLGYETINAALSDQLPLGLMAALVLAKLLATSITVGSGSSGGVIGPSLYLGAMAGGAFGTLFHALLPQLTATGGAYALVGMAAVFAATAQAPITAIFTIFELANDYYIMLPLMVACVTSAYVAQRLSPHTIYSIGLSRRGIEIQIAGSHLPPTPGATYLELEVEPESAAAGKRLRELHIPEDCVLISVIRRDRVVIARGNTLLQPGDRVRAACARRQEEALRSLMRRPG